MTLVARIKPEDEATLIYTSGTTGVPKGVILTHGNLVSNIKTASRPSSSSPPRTRSCPSCRCPISSSAWSCSPMSTRAARSAYAESVEAVAKNLLEVRPHIMVSVPRVFEKIYAKVMDQVLASPALRRKIFFWALQVGRAYGALKLDGEADPRRARRSAAPSPRSSSSPRSSPRPAAGSASSSPAGPRSRRTSPSSSTPSGWSSSKATA